MTSSPHSRATSSLRPSSAGHHRRARGRDPQRLEGHRHRVRRELPAARARAGRGDLLQRVELLLGDLAGGILADRLEHLLDRDVLILVAPGRIEPP